ncbi:MAG TPA: phage head closure protein [Rhizomicrobium sp.]|jgi:SPP1 family predicted phage head-tail adaptor
MLGLLNQRAQVLARAAVADGAGGIGEDWTIVATIWLRIDAQTGGDVYGPDAEESRIRHKLAARRNAELRAGRRLAVSSRTFRIHAVLDDGAPSQFVALVCEEVSP